MNDNKSTLVYRIADQYYGLPAENVEQVLQAVAVTEVPNQAKNVMGVINLQGTVLPVIDMKRKIGLDSEDLAPEDRFIVLSNFRLPVAIAVDEVLDVVDLESTEIVQPEQIAANLDCISGMVKTEFGLALLLEMNDFLKEDLLRMEFAEKIGA